MMPGELLMFASLVFGIDQASKVLVTARLDFAPRRCNGSRPRLRLYRNRRIGLGLVSDPRLLFLLWSFAVSGIVLLIYYLPPFQGWPAQAGLGAAIGGASSNLVDCVRHRSVIDFIDLRVWPVFNLADVSIVLGVGVALWSIP